MKIERTRIHFFSDVFSCRRRPRILRSLFLVVHGYGEAEGACMTSNRVKVVFLQTVTEPSYIMLYKQKINPQTEINTRPTFLDTIVFAMLFLQKYMILLYYK